MINYIPRGIRREKMSMTLENGVLMPSLVSSFYDLKKVSFLKYSILGECEQRTLETSKSLSL